MRLDAYTSRAWRRRSTHATRQCLVADPFDSEESGRRFEHGDVSTLPSAELWGEQVLVTVELARRAARHVRPQLIKAWPGQVSDQDWLLERLGVLRGELARRGLHGA